MHKPLFRIAVGSVAAVGGLLVASAMPAGAATSVRAETMAPVPFLRLYEGLFITSQTPR